MPKFISGELIRAARERLGNAKVRTTFFEYCILLAALTDQGNADRSTALNGTTLKPIIDQAALWISSPDLNSTELDPYFNPLDKKYKGRKYWTNGPSDTIPRWETQGDLVEGVHGAEVKTVTVADFDPSAIREFFSIGETQRVPFFDLAAWWFRKTDLTDLSQNVEIVTQVDLENALLDVLGLDRVSAEQIFHFDESTELSPLELTDAAADPREYMPPYHPRSPVGLVAKNKAPVYSPGDINQLMTAISERGYLFSELQVATYVAAVRAKPFVILAGISGTGKTQLPIICAESTKSRVEVCPVRPNWTDSSEILGYTNINGQFIPGPLLRMAREAIDNPTVMHFFVLDEMNLAHVEYYLAEVLSVMETARETPAATTVTQPLCPNSGDPDWETVYLPSNFALVGSINVDESTNPISTKVLDRAFVIKFDEVDLNSFLPTSTSETVSAWDSGQWGANRKPLRAILSPEVLATASDIASHLEVINKILRPAKRSFGYRLRDDIIQFVLATQDVDHNSKDLEGRLTHPLDIALAAKILPRLEGSTRELERSINDLIDFLNQLGDENLSFHRTIDSLGELAKSFKYYGYASYWN